MKRTKKTFVKLLGALAKVLDGNVRVGTVVVGDVTAVGGATAVGGTTVGGGATSGGGVISVVPRTAAAIGVTTGAAVGAVTEGAGLEEAGLEEAGFAPSIDDNDNSATRRTHLQAVSGRGLVVLYLFAINCLYYFNGFLSK